ncbi:MAG: hypothetical protein EBZ48_03150 [Proteobacteria bacterium]|nr:hypothetical protein [Pseudomonadota bacterium]
MRFRFTAAVLSTILGLLSMMAAPSRVVAQSDCLPTIQVTFSPDGLSVYVVSNKDLSNVVLKFCDGSPDYKFDGLSGLTGTFSYLSKELAGVWVKSGCNQSGDGPGYGEFFGRSCGGGDPDPTPTPTPTATATPTPDPKVTICHIPPGNPANAQTIQVSPDAVAAHLAHGDILGPCPVDCVGAPFGNAVIDQCGVCGGDNSTCKDCAGVPNGGAVVDACGVCGGTATDPESCDPCDGVIDQCGVCNGANQCLDCAGVPNGDTELDCCGVCGGDGKSCLRSCGKCERSQIQRSLQRVLVELVNGIRVSSAKQLRCDGRSGAIVTARLEFANRLFMEGVFLVSEVFRRNLRLCGVSFCEASASAPARLSLDENLTELYNLLREAKAGAAKGCGRPCKGKCLQPKLRALASAMPRAP